MPHKWKRYLAPKLKGMTKQCERVTTIVYKEKRTLSAFFVRASCVGVRASDMRCMLEQDLVLFVSLT